MQAHQLRHAQGGVGVVDVDGHLVGQVVQGLVLPQVLFQDALHRGGHQQVLLAQAQDLARLMVVGGIENLGDDLRHGVPLQSLGVVAPGEGRHIEAAGGLGAPQDQLIHRAAVISGDVHIIRNGHHRLVVEQGHPELAVVVPAVDLAAQLDLHGLVLPGVDPHIAHAQPIVGELHLPAVHDLLLEDAELVADGKAGDRHVQAGGGVHIAGGQPPQAAVAQTGVRLHGVQVVDVHAVVGQGGGELLLQAQIVQVVAQGCAHQELHGHIVYLFLMLLGHLAAVFGVFDQQHVIDHIAQRPVDLLGGGAVHVAAVTQQKGLIHRFDYLFLVHFELLCGNRISRSGIP